MKILIAFDGSSLASQIVELAISRAKKYKAQVYAVTSLEGDDEKNLQTIEKSKTELDSVQKRFIDEGLSCETHLMITGFEAEDDIVQFAKDNHIDEIIIGIKRKSKVGKFVFGSTAQFVILMAPCPVLTIKKT